MIGIGVTVIVGVIGWYVIRSQNTSKDLPQRILNTLKTSLPINHKQRLVEWNNFTDLPMIDECLLTNSASCFPTLIFTSDIFGAGKFSVKPFKNREIDKATVRSILLANTDYQNLFLTLPPSRVNSSGFYVDDLIDMSLSNNMNPLASWAILDSILSPLIEINANFSLLEDNSIVTLPTIVKNIGVYFVAFSSSPESTPLSSSKYKDNPAFQQLQLLSLSPMQKAIILYFYTYANKNAYIMFIKNFPEIFLPQIGVFPLKLVKSQEEFQNTESLSTQFIFCDPKNQKVLHCKNGNDAMICFQQTINRICQAQYFLLEKEP